MAHRSACAIGHRFFNSSPPTPVAGAAALVTCFSLPLFAMGPTLRGRAEHASARSYLLTYGSELLLQG